MRKQVGITGHQPREGIEWGWVEKTIRTELTNIGSVHKAYSCLAAGSDQVFAETALKLGIAVVAVIPMEGYERFFKGAGLSKYRKLIRQCETLQLSWKGEEERAFFEAGKRVVDAADILIAVWDGLEAEGVGGTGDVVLYARSKGKAVIHIDPFMHSITR